jgi:hypothetical protein
MYRWVDSQGHVHYSQTPPAGTAVKPQVVEVQKPQPYAVDPAVAAQNQQVSQQAAVQAQADARDAEQVARNKALQDQNCQRLKAKLQILEQANLMFTMDADGQRHYESDADHEKAIQQARDELASQCGGQQ